MYLNLLEFTQKCIIIIDWIIYVTTLDSHQGFEQDVVQYLGVRNGIVLDVWVTETIVGSDIEDFGMNA